MSYEGIDVQGVGIWLLHKGATNGGGKIEACSLDSTIYTLILLFFPSLSKEGVLVFYVALVTLQKMKITFGCSWPIHTYKVCGRSY